MLFGAAVDAGEAFADLRTLAEVGALPRAAIEARPVVTLRGQVLALRSTGEGTEACLEDQSGGIRIAGIDAASSEEAGGAAVTPAVGDTIEVRGRVEGRRYAPVVRAERIIVTGRRPLPPPRRCEPGAFFAGNEDCRLVEVEGIVEQAWPGDAVWFLEIQTAGRLFTAVVPEGLAASIAGTERDPRKLVDEPVRVAGVVETECNQRGEIVRPVVRVDRPEWFFLRGTAAGPVFKNDAVPAQAIGAFRVEARPGHRVRTFGQVIHAVPRKTLFLQNGHAGVRVGIGKGAIGVDEVFERGDLVEVAGFLDRSGWVASIRNASATRLEAGLPPTPLVATPATILAANRARAGQDSLALPGDYDGCLVGFSGVMLQSQPTEAGGLLVVRCDGTIATAEADETTFRDVAGTEPGSFVALVGVALIDREPASGSGGAGAPPRLRLILRDADDFRVVRRPPWWTPERLLAVLGITATVLAAALVWGATLRRQLTAQTRLLAAEMRSRRDAALEFEATLRERNRLAANLHDTLQQTIGGIGFQLDACEAAGGSHGAESSRHFAVARRMVGHAATELQGSVWAMRSLPLDGKPFGEALSALVARVSEGHDVALTVRCEGPFGDLPEFVSGSILLIVQEAVHNALKHGSPGRVDVTVSDDPVGGTLRAVVADDGRGFSVGFQAGPHEGHFGIQGMRERTERLGGGLTVRSRPDGGTTVEAVVARRDYDADLGSSAPSRS